MWTASGIAKNVASKFIQYQIPTSKGQSGCPIIKRVGEE